MSVEWLPADDLPIAKPEHGRTLRLVSGLTGLDPADLGSSKSDHGVALGDKALGDNARPNVLGRLLEPFARLVAASQSGPARGLQLNFRVEQRRETRRRRRA